MPDAFDLDAYFARIGYGGPANADLATLSALHAAHVAAIPFESLDPLVGRPVKLDLASLQAKMVRSRRGGYCFEQNHLFRGALETIGFAVDGLAARVAWMSPPGAPLGPRLHMLLKVEVGGAPWLADVGFGAHLQDGPLRLEVGPEQATGAARYRLQRDGELLALEVHQAGDWRRPYVFDLTPQLPSDYVAPNWYASTSPEFLFTSLLVVERLTPEARYNLVDTRLTERRMDGTTRERLLESADAFGAALDEVFGIEPPVPAAEVFAKIAPA